MKTAKIIQLIIAFMAISSFCAFAQMQYPQRPPFGQPGERVERPVRVTPNEKAERRTDEMHKEVNLTEKQYKKIYRIYLKEEEARESSMGFPMGPPSGGMRGGMPQGGFPGGFEMGGGFPGGPPSGMPFPGGFGEPQKPTVGGKEIDSDEYIDAREEKIKKILTPEQYSTLRRIHPDPSGFFKK